MHGLIKLLRFDFLPTSTDVGLLLLRLWLGLSLLLLHGWGKLTGFSEMSGKFPDPLGVGSTASLALTVFGEVVCGLLLALGLVTRFAALVLIVTMGVAFLLVHKASLKMGPGSGELAYVYLAGFVTLFVTGPGRFSLDQWMGRGPENKSGTRS
jgi:putative oxidoreductase